MDFMALAMFFLVTFLFALFVAAILKFFVFRFISMFGLGSMPYVGWVLLVIVIMFALQFGGVSIAGVYSQFFGWLSKIMTGFRLVII